MAKYSTGNSSGGDGGGACELCGQTADSLSEANVAGAQLRVCSNCATHNDDETRTSDQSSETRDDGSVPNRKRRAAQNAAKLGKDWDGDSSHWEEGGTNYDDDQLPYLVRDYGDRVEEARQAAGLKRGELAEELDVSETDLLAVEQNRANQAGIGGSLIGRLEEELDVTLAERR